MSSAAVSVKDKLDALVRDLQALDVNNLAAASGSVKKLGIGLAAIVVVAAGYWFFVKGEVNHYKKLQGDEQTLRQEFLQKDALAVNLPAYLAQVADMKKRFSVMLEQLPNGKEVPDLLVSISQAALGRGLKIETFAPQNEKLIDFYAEDPINIRVKGTYHEIGEFVSDLSALPRIVTVDNVDLSASHGAPTELNMSLIAKTYRYRTHRNQKGPGQRRPGGRP